MKEFWKRSTLFVLIGLLIYAGAYYASEQLVYKYAKRNRFYTVRMARQPGYDYVILGASHALPLDFEDVNVRLQQTTGARIINLSTPGGGLVPNRLLLEYLLTRHKAKSVIYILDSFFFYSREWNEDRLKDVRLFRRAPFDPDLAKLLVAYSFRGAIGPGTALDYISGFSKINNADRFKPDLSEDELTRFRRVHKPTSRDIKRVEYLYPPKIDEQVFNLADEPMDVMWGHHPAFGPPFLDDSCRIDLPPCVGTTARAEPWPGSELEYGVEFEWPLAPRKGDGARDLSVIPGPESKIADWIRFSGFDRGWYGITNGRSQVGFGLRWDAKVFRHLWFWHVFGGMPGYPWYGRNYNFALEPWTSYPDGGLLRAIDNGSAMRIGPLSSVTTRMLAVVYDGTDRIAGISDAGEGMR